MKLTAWTLVAMLTGLVALANEEDDGPRFSDWGAPLNLGPVVNTGAGEAAPCISRDGLSLYFFSDRPGGFGGNDIWVSERASRDDPWGPPQNLGPTVNTSGNENAPTLSRNGRRLYFASNAPGGSGGLDLYVSRRSDKRDNFGWQPPVNLGDGVNTPADEAAATLFEDDDGTTTLYFHSNRPGGLGLDDIYASSLVEDEDDDTFGPAILVAELSSPFADRLPSVRRDGREMFLTSNRPGTFGLLDLWVSTRATAAYAWSTPVNLGPVVNSPATDGRAALSDDGTELYFHSTRPGGSGGFDLFVTRRTRLKPQDRQLAVE
jgi:hypothetical protein